MTPLVNHLRHWQHTKRQSIYQEIGRADVQASTRPLQEGDVVVVYRAEDDHLYVRRDEEFEDGRFSEIIFPKRPTIISKLPFVDRLAAWLGIWALKHLFGGDCDTDVREDWPNDPTMICSSCDAKRLIKIMDDLLHE